jgi:hypothetical protein
MLDMLAPNWQDFAALITRRGKGGSKKYESLLTRLLAL